MTIFDCIFYCVFTICFFGLIGFIINYSSKHSSNNKGFNTQNELNNIIEKYKYPTWEYSKVTKTTKVYNKE